MGINVGLYDESGAIVGEEILDEQNLLARLISSFPQREPTHCLQYLDLYGDTIFNRLQMPRFLDEWEIFEKQAADADQKQLVAAVRELAQQCKECPHLYLKFVGD